MLLASRLEVLCILEAVLMVSPKRQYLGILVPTIPATMLPATCQGKKKSYIIPPLHQVAALLGLKCSQHQVCSQSLQRSRQDI